MPISRRTKELLRLKRQSRRIAVDIGGTFTDVALEGGESLVTAKTLTTSENPVQGVLDGIEIVCEQASIEPGQVGGVIHGTTLATNALIERKGASVGFLTTEGFRDIVEIAYERRYDQYDIGIDKPDLLVTRERCWTVPERINAKGNVLKELNLSSLDNLLVSMDAEGVQSLAICLLHSYLNPSHEQKLREQIRQLRPQWSVTLSSEVCPEIREFDRACTTLANAYIKPLMSTYLYNLELALKDIGFTCPLFIVTSGGGITTVKTAAEFPIRLVESGPSGGAVMAAKVAKLCGIPRAVSFDMGGTTAKLCLVDGGTPQRSRQFEIGRAARFVKGSGLPVRIPVIDMIEIGAGGGSVAHVDGLDRLRIGPHSAGSEPGPVCYGRGGQSPTVTDADLTLGFIDPDYFAEGRVTLSEEAAAAAIKKQIGEKLGLNVRNSAYGVSQMVNENMANAARVHAVEHGTEMSNRTMIAFGGNGPLHATRVAEKLGINEVIVPVDPGVGSAVGFLSAPISYELIRSLYMLISQFDEKAVRQLLADMEKEARAVVLAGTKSGNLMRHRTAFMRYEGQGHEIEITMPDGALPRKMGPWLFQQFEKEYQRIFGRTVPNVNVEIMSWGYVAMTATKDSVVMKSAKKTWWPKPKGIRKLFWGQNRKSLIVPFYERTSLKSGAKIVGPALIIESQTTTLVSPSFDATVDASGNIVMRQHAR